MHCVQLADIAASLSHLGTAILASRTTIPSKAVTCYWASSRNRIELWQHTIFRYRKAERDGDYGRMQQWWIDHGVVLEEVLVSEILSRVVAAITFALERKTGVEEVSPITHSVLSTHMDVSNRVHQLMLQGKGNSVQGVVRLNRLRKAVERWTDVLLSRVSLDQEDCLRFCFDTEITMEFVFESRQRGLGPARDVASWLETASMADVLRMRTNCEPALPSANRNVADSVLLLLRPELFDDFGVARSTIMHRILLDSTDESPGSGAYMEYLESELNQPNEPHFERWYT